MQMTNEEIVRDYRQASNKQKQVRILADLNQTSPSEILTILATEGVEGVKMPEKIMPRKKPLEAAASSALPPVYDRIETILAALPEGASKYALDTASVLVVELFKDYITRRLGKEARDEA